MMRSAKLRWSIGLGSARDRACGVRRLAKRLTTKIRKVVGLRRGRRKQHASRVRSPEFRACALVYGAAVAAGEAAGAGEPKLNCTGGGGADRESKRLNARPVS